MMQDSFEKVIKEFKLIGFSLVEKNEFNIIFVDDYSKDKLYIDRDDKNIRFNGNFLTIAALGLINRTFRLWGIEVC